MATELWVTDGNTNRGIRILWLTLARNLAAPLVVVAPALIYLCIIARYILPLQIMRMGQSYNTDGTALARCI
jgi:hypothetical protein